MSEARVMAGAEPFYAEGNDVGVLVSHGYTGSPQSMRPHHKKVDQTWPE
jgi:carboxylesterase